MPFAARVGDPTGHPGVITGPGCRHRPDRRDAGRGRRRPAHVQLPAAGGAPADAVPDGQHDGDDRRPPGAARRRHGRLRRADRHGRPDGERGMSMSELFVGQRHRLPDAGQRHAAASPSSRSDEEIAESMRLILGTSPGERPMRPDFGCPIHDHVFAPADATTTA